MSSPQRRNAELVDLLRTDFPHWDIYNQDAYARALQFALMQPGLIGAWGGVLDRNTPALVDVSGNGMHLTFNGDAHISQGTNRQFAPYIALDGTGDYMSRADEAKLDILGTEARLASGLRGLTFSAWVRFGNAAAASENISSKWNATGNQRSWIMLRTNTGTLQTNVSSAGTVTTAAAASTGTIAANVWTHVAWTFQPSTAVRNYINGAAGGVTTSSVPAALFNSSSAFVLGGDGAFGGLMTGDIALPWLSASLVSADLISYYYHMTKGLFGV